MRGAKSTAVLRIRTVYAYLNHSLKDLKNGDNIAFIFWNMVINYLLF